MPTLSPQQFVKKWSQIQLKERSTAQSHFNDICALIGHQTPLEMDPKGAFFTFLNNMLVLYREQFKGKSRQPAAWSEAAQHIIAISEIETLDHIHTALDHAVLNAYGWPHNLSEEQVLERLLALNLARQSGTPDIRSL